VVILPSPCPWSHGGHLEDWPIGFGGGLAFRDVWRLRARGVRSDGCVWFCWQRSEALHDVVLLPFVFSGCPRARCKSKSMMIHKGRTIRIVRSMAPYRDLLPGNLAKRLPSSTQLFSFFLFGKTRACKVAFPKQTRVQNKQGRLLLLVVVADRRST
jgi:hypothetical protein